MNPNTTQSRNGRISLSPQTLSSFGRRVHVRNGIDAATGIAFRRPGGAAYLMLDADGDTSTAQMRRMKRSAYDFVDRELAA